MTETTLNHDTAGGQAINGIGFLTAKALHQHSHKFMAHSCPKMLWGEARHKTM